MLSENSVETLVADWSTEDPELEEAIGRTLQSLGSKQIPVLAVFPADDPFRPIVLQGSYTKASLTEAIEQASSKVAKGNDSNETF